MRKITFSFIGFFAILLFCAFLLTPVLIKADNPTQGGPGAYGSTTPNPAAAASTGAAPAGCFKTVFGTNACNYNDWIKLVWQWAMIIIIPLSVLMTAWAGFLWMTSAGNPDKIGAAKKVLTGVVSGLLLLILARIFIVNILGINDLGALGSIWNVQ